MNSDTHNAIVAIPPNQSLLLADSRFRSPVQTPYNFTANLSSALYGTEFFYQSLYWTQPLFTHNVTNNEIRFSIENDDLGAGTVYVAYVKPFNIFRTFDGNSPLGNFFNTPQPGSYAAELASALNDPRLFTNNMASITPTFSGGTPLVFTVRYAASQGFVIQANDAFTLQDCNWLSGGHFVHGFGIFDPNDQKYHIPPSFSPTQALLSNEIPILLLSRFILVYSEQLTKDRRLISFHSAGHTDSISSFVNEIAILPLTLENLGVYHVESVTEDSTVVSIRNGTQKQVVDMVITDEFGRELVPGNNQENVLLDPLVPFNAKAALFDPAQNFRSPVAINYLTFGNNNIPSPIVSTNTYNFSSFAVNQLSTALPEPYNFGLFNTIVGNDSPQVPFIPYPSSPLGWYFRNTNIFNFTAFTVNFPVPLAGIPCSSYDATFLFLNTALNPQIIYTSQTIHIVPPQLGVSFVFNGGNPTSGTPTYVNDPTTYQWVFLLQLTNVVAPLAPSNTFSMIPTTPFTETTSISPATGYINPTVNGEYPYGPLAATALPDDLIHQCVLLLE